MTNARSFGRPAKIAQSFRLYAQKKSGRAEGFSEILLIILIETSLPIPVLFGNLTNNGYFTKMTLCAKLEETPSLFMRIRNFVSQICREIFYYQSEIIQSTS